MLQPFGVGFRLRPERAACRGLGKALFRLGGRGCIEGRAAFRSSLHAVLSATYRQCMHIGDRQHEMATLTIRKLDPGVKERLRVRAAQRGHSMEEEARRILSESCSQAARRENLAEIALRLFGHENGVERELASRQGGREPARFG